MRYLKRRERRVGGGRRRRVEVLKTSGLEPAAIGGAFKKVI